MRITTYDAARHVWTLRLVDDHGRDVPPINIVKQADGYVASFPRVATRTVRLQMSTVRGSLDFNWSTD